MRLRYGLGILATTLLALDCGGGTTDGAVKSAPSASSAQHVTMTVAAASVLRTVDSSFLLGGNLGPWVTPAQIGAPADRFIADRGARLIRYPGGMASAYCWKTVRAQVQNGAWDDWSWGVGLDRYFAFLNSIAGRPLLGVNIFDHTIDGSLHRAADEARDLASRAVAAGFAGAFYEIGNEPDQCCPVISAEEYVERFVVAAQSVKGADPSARVLGPAISNPDPAWRDAFIAGLARRGQLPLLDTFSFHYYGAWLASWNTAAIDLALPQQLSAEIKSIRAALAAAGAPGVTVAVTEYNAALWDNVTREAYSIEQALWLADVTGELLRSADIGNVWIDLSGDFPPHSLISDKTSPVSRTSNYWPFVLAAQSLGLGRRDPAVAVLQTTCELPTSRVTLHAVRGRDGRIGVLFVNKGDALQAEVRLLGRSCSATTALRIDAATLESNQGTVSTPAPCREGAISIDLSRLSAASVVLD